MAIRDYLEDKVEVTEDFKGIPFKRPQTASASLVSVDSDMEQAQKAAQNRGRREAIQKQIDNLENHNKELLASLENLRKNTLSNMDEDKIVAMAKAKGIRDEDIETWLKSRAQRSAREISLDQKAEIARAASAEKQKAEAIEKQAKNEAKKRVLEARKAYEEANVKVEEEQEDAKKAQLDYLESDFKTLLNDYESEYKEKLDLTLTPRKIKETTKTDETTIPSIPSGVKLNKTEEALWNLSTTTKKERELLIGKAIDREDEERAKKAEEEAKKREAKAEEEVKEYEAKAKKKKEVLSRRQAIKENAKNTNLSEAKKRDLVSKYRKTFDELEEEKPSRAEVEKELFGE